MSITSPLFQVTWQGPASHEARPEDPEQESAKQREDVWDPSCGHLLWPRDIPDVQSSAHTEAEEGREHVKKDRVSNVKCKVERATNELVDSV